MKNTDIDLDSKQHRSSIAAKIVEEFLASCRPHMHHLDDLASREAINVQLSEASQRLSRLIPDDTERATLIMGQPSGILPDRVRGKTTPLAV